MGRGPIPSALDEADDHAGRLLGLHAQLTGGTELGIDAGRFQGRPAALEIADLKREPDEAGERPPRCCLDAGIERGECRRRHDLDPLASGIDEVSVALGGDRLAAEPAPKEIDSRTRILDRDGVALDADGLVRVAEPARPAGERGRGVVADEGAESADRALRRGDQTKAQELLALWQLDRT